MPLDLFAGVAVSDLPRAVLSFERLFGEVESFEPMPPSVTGRLTEQCHLYFELQPEHAGHSMVTLFVDDFDGFLEAAAERGLDPQMRAVRIAGDGLADAVVVCLPATATARPRRR